MKSLATSTLFWLASTAFCLAQTPPASAPSSGLSKIAARGPSFILSLEAAQAAINACKTKGYNVSVSVVDSADVLKILLASDGAFQAGVVTSTGKAVAARDFNMSTSELTEKIKTDPALAERSKSNPDYYISPGGLPLRVGNEVIGAIGVAGAVSADHLAGARDTEECARAGLDKIRARLK